ncbi:hypothetical protein EDM22_12290 [Agromyces tardus]|uniref:Uncharacterized protein n=1 Tax=Agromyces tardus TaxID=2583849 RepID=A0A3M8A825_9MICO|nr:hypothetical protein [Agromyces tardus]RNB47403.1 hypothetical protein EDM22_12290 [Agromyces tardus]
MATREERFERAAEILLDIAERILREDEEAALAAALAELVVDGEAASIAEAAAMLRADSKG